MTITDGAKPPQTLMFTNEVCRYMQQKFNAGLLDPNAHVPYPDGWPLDFLIDCNRAVNEILAAFRNRGEYEQTFHRAELISKAVQTAWDVEEYALHISARNYGQNAKLESNLLNMFPPIHEPAKEYRRPTLLTDVRGHALAWYLPGLITRTRQVGEF